MKYGQKGLLEDINKYFDEYTEAKVNHKEQLMQVPILDGSTPMGYTPGGFTHSGQTPTGLTGSDITPAGGEGLQQPTLFFGKQTLNNDI